MISKREFIERYEVVERFWKQAQELGDALNRLLLEGGAVITYGDELMIAYIDTLAEDSGIDKDTIGWLLFEGGGQMWQDENDTNPRNVITAEDLWEFYKEV